MSHTVRLEGLSASVNLRDLRSHFSGLEIPEGGVIIVGGKRGVAFITFTKWVDAQTAIQSSGRPIKDSIVSVSPSSSAEMEYETSYSSRNGVYEDRNLNRRDSLSRNTHVYVHVTVTSGVTTTTSVRRHFEGLNIAGIVPFPDKSGALLKFFNSADAYDGIWRYRDSKDVTVVWSNEREWEKYGGRISYKDNHSYKSRHGGGHHSRSPERLSHSSRNSRSPRWHSRSPQRYSRSHQKYTRSPHWHSRSPLSRSRSPRLHSQTPHMKSKSPQKRRRSPRNPSIKQHPIYDGEFHVHVTNLNHATRKDDLRKWFFNLVSVDHIKFLNVKGRKTKECFVTLKNEKDHKKVLGLDKVTFNGHLLFISSISKSCMRNLLTDRKALFSHHHSKGKCLYLRNFPSDVTKRDIQKFFAGFSLNEEDISLLCDRDGVGLGEVIVSFLSEEDLERAEKLHRKKFKDKEIKLRRIPQEKLQSFLYANSVSLIPEDPYDCVTQEDDLLDEDSDQEKITRDDDQDDHIPDEDSGIHQTDNTHECVTQADDAPDDSAVQVNDAPSTECISNGNSVQADNDTGIPEGATSVDDGIGQRSAVDDSASCTEDEHFYI